MGWAALFMSASPPNHRIFRSANLPQFQTGANNREAFVAEKPKAMSQKKSLEEQSPALLTGRADWLEPFTEWINTAKNAGEIAERGSLQEKRVLAQKMFGLKLILDYKKARGSCVKPWSLLRAPVKLVEWCAVEVSNL